MRTLVILCLALAMSAAIAGDLYSFPTGVVAVGDSVANLRNKGGEPSRIEPIENRFGAKLGERWEYHMERKQVTFTIQDGKVVGIYEAF
jgi:hypothetical protein